MFIKFAKAKIESVYRNPQEFEGFLKVAGKDVEARVFKKIASIPAIEAEPENYLYIRNRSVSAEETYGCNMNFDGFPSSELKEKYATFIHCPVDVDHINNGDDDIIGIVLDSVYVPKQLYSINDNTLYPFSEEKRVALLKEGKKLKLIGDYVENLLAIDKKRANKRNAGLVEAIQKGEITDTSMGCLNAGTPITTESGYKNIEDIQIGDLVRTHTGELKHVTGLFSKPFNEGIYNIKVQGNGEEFKVTYEHPFYTIKRDKVLKWGKPDFIDIESKELSPEWIKTQDLQVGDYLAYGFSDEVMEDENATIEFARLLGYYLSDGMYGKDHRNNTRYLTFDFGNNEKDYADEVFNLVKYLTNGYEPVIKQRGNCWTVIVGNTEFANKVFYYAGRYSKVKKLIPKVLYWKPEIQLELLGAFINGDGGNYNGSSYFEIANYELAQQLIQIACRNRIVWSIQKIKHIANENSVCKTGTESICWQVRFGKTANKKLATVTDKSTYFGARPADRKFYWKNYLWSKISKIGFDEDWVGTIYNFEVEDDESYIANNIVMHNCSVQESECSICGNVAHTEDEYCDHVKYSKGKMISYNGLKPKLCYEKNRGLDFFEDSVILSETFAKKSGTSAQAGGEGADTNAKVLEVVAGKQCSILDSIKKKADISTLKTDVVIIGGEPKDLEQKREEYEEDREEYLDGDSNKKSMKLEDREVTAKELYSLVKKAKDYPEFEHGIKSHLEVDNFTTPSVIKLKSFYNKYIQARHRDEILAVSKQIMDSQEKIDKKSFKDRLKAMGYDEKEIDEVLAYQGTVKGNFDLQGKLKNFLVEGMRLYNEVEKTADLQGASYGNELGTGLGDLTKRYYDSKKDDTGHLNETEGDAGDNGKNYFWEEPVDLQHIKAKLKVVMSGVKDEVLEFVKGYGVTGVAPETVFDRFGSSDEVAGSIETLKQENKVSTDDFGKLKVIGSEIDNAGATTEAQESTEDINPEGQKQQSDLETGSESEGKFDDFESFENYLKNPNGKYVILSGTDQSKTTDAEGNSIPAYLHPDNIQANENLKTDIRTLGKVPILIDEGYYLGQLEGKSYLVDGGSLKDGVFLGLKYNQESVVVPQGIYSIPAGVGSNNIGSVNDISEEIISKGQLAPVNKTNGEPVILWGEEAEAQDGYSVINLGGQKIAFSLDIEWDKQGTFGQYLKTASKKTASTRKELEDQRTMFQHDLDTCLGEDNPNQEEIEEYRHRIKEINKELDKLDKTADTGMWNDAEGFWGHYGNQKPVVKTMMGGEVYGVVKNVGGEDIVFWQDGTQTPVRDLTSFDWDRIRRAGKKEDCDFCGGKNCVIYNKATDTSVCQNCKKVYGKLQKTAEAIYINPKRLKVIPIIEEDFELTSENWLNTKAKGSGWVLLEGMDEGVLVEIKAEDEDEYEELTSGATIRAGDNSYDEVYGSGWNDNYVSPEKLWERRNKLDLVEDEVKDTSDIKDDADMIKYTGDDEDLKKYEGKTMIERIQSKVRRLQNMLKIGVTVYDAEQNPYVMPQDYGTKTVETKLPVEIVVVPHPTKRGFTLRHNQEAGWSGALGSGGYTWGWYKNKNDAQKRANELMESYNSGRKTAGKSGDQWEKQPMDINGRGIERYDSQYDKDFMDLEQGSGDPANYKDLKKNQDKEFTTDEDGMVQKVKALQRKLSNNINSLGYIENNGVFEAGGNYEIESKNGGDAGHLWTVKAGDNNFYLEGNQGDISDSAYSKFIKFVEQKTGWQHAFGKKFNLTKLNSILKKAVSPEGWEGTVKDMKGKEGIETPWALAWWMKNKGYKSHKNEDGTEKKSNVVLAHMNFVLSHLNDLVDDRVEEQEKDKKNWGFEKNDDIVEDENIKGNLEEQLKKTKSALDYDLTVGNFGTKPEEAQGILNGINRIIANDPHSGDERAVDLYAGKNGIIVVLNQAIYYKALEELLSRIQKEFPIIKGIDVDEHIKSFNSEQMPHDETEFLDEGLKPNAYSKKKTAEFGLDKTPLNVPLDTVTTHEGDDDDSDQSGMEKIMKFIDKHSNRMYEDYDRPKDEDGKPVNQQDGHNYGMESGEDGVKMLEDTKKEKTALGELKKTLSDMVPTEFTPNSQVEIKDKDSNSSEQMGIVKDVKQEVGQDGQMHNAVELQDGKMYSTDQHNIQKTSSVIKNHPEGDIIYWKDGSVWKYYIQRGTDKSETYNTTPEELEEMKNEAKGIGTKTAQSEEHLAEDAKNFKDIDEKATEIKKDVDELESDDEKLKKESKKKMIDELMSMDFGDSDKLEKISKLDSIDLSDNVLDVPEIIVKQAIQDSTDEGEPTISQDDADSLWDDADSIPKRNLKEVKAGNGFVVNPHGSLKAKSSEITLENMWDV